MHCNDTQVSTTKVNADCMARTQSPSTEKLGGGSRGEKNNLSNLSNLNLVLLWLSLFVDSFI